MDLSTMMGNALLFVMFITQKTFLYCNHVLLGLCVLFFMFGLYVVTLKDF